MSWYYSLNNERLGPVDEPAFQALVGQGRITSDTLVWRDGMANWIPYSQAVSLAPAPGLVTAPMPAGTASAAPCAECGQSFPPDEMVRYEGRFICPSCKPIFFQKVKEGAVVPGDRRYAGFWIRFLAYVIDAVILQVFFFLVGLVLGTTAGESQSLAIVMGVVSFVVSVAYDIYFTGKDGATPGKMALKLRVIRADGARVGYGLATGRFFAEILSAIIFLIGYIMAGFDEEKRALHDRICDTRVVRE